MEVSFWYLGSSRRKCRTHAVLSTDVESRQLGSWQGGLLNSIPVEGQGGTVPSHFTGFLLEALAPSVTCLLTHTVTFTYMPGAACHSHVLFSGEEPCLPTCCFFLYSFSSGCVSDSSSPSSRSARAYWLSINSFLLFLTQFLFLQSTPGSCLLCHSPFLSPSPTRKWGCRC